MFLLLFMAIFQGITEFLPVSSSGHLVFIENLFGQTAGMTVNIALHIGTLFSVLIYYRKKIIQLLLVIKDFLLFKKTLKDPDVRFIIMILISTFVTATIGFSIKDYIESIFVGNRAFLFLFFTFFITAIFLYTNKFISQTSPKPFTFGKAVLLGIIQGIAVFPGISRSGSTITAGILLGMTGEDAAEYSFMLAIPAIAGAGILESKNLFSTATINLTHLGIGVIVSAITGYFALAFLIKLLSGKKLHWFSYYLIPLSLFSLYLYFSNPF